MLPPTLLSLILAVLLATPLAGQLWHYWRRSVPAAITRRPSVRESKPGPPYEWNMTTLYVAYAVAAIAIAALLARELGAAPLGARHLSVALGMLAGGMACLLAAPFYPLSGPIAYLLLSYTFPREHAVTETLMAIDAMSWMAALSLAATVVWSLRRFGRIAMPRGRIVSAASAFAAWLAVAIVVAVVNGRPLEPDLVGRSERYVHALALFLVAAASRPGLRDVRILALAMSLALVIRQLLLTAVWLNEQNLAMLAAMTVPFALAVAACRPLSVLQIPLAAAVAYLAVMVLLVQNRGAMLGLGASFLGLWATARARGRWLVVLVAVSLTAIVLAARQGLLNRFLEIYADGRFLGTAAERIDIWWGGLQIASGHWLFGVGPGNFALFLGPYLSPGREINNPHNSFVEVLSEAGLPALILYVVMFVVAAQVLMALARQFRSGWRRNLASGLLGAFAAYLVAGFFLSNPSLVWMWVLLGVAAAAEHTSPRPDRMPESGA